MRSTKREPEPGNLSSFHDQDLQAQRRMLMVEQDLRGRDITDPRVLAAMMRIPREEFVPDRVRHLAYNDHPLSIGHGQTISQPYIVAIMTQLAEPSSHSRALDIGTGSGYQAAVLSEICQEVYSVEIVAPLAVEARSRLARLGYLGANVSVRHGDGYQGWPEKAPFDVIIVAAAPDHVPRALVEQLAPGGKLVIPVGTYDQMLVVVEHGLDGYIHYDRHFPVAFVPMTGRDQHESFQGPPL